MKKIRLDLDHLRVESFETGDEAGQRGTVHGHGLSNERCNSDWSCVDTCYFLSCFDTQCMCVQTQDYGSCGYTYCAAECTGESCGGGC